MDVLSMLSTVQGTIKFAKETFSSVLQSKIDEKSRKQIDKAMQDIGNTQDQLYDLRDELYKLQTERDELRKVIEQYEDWEKKLGQYKLINTSGGAIVYYFQGEPKHYICPRCANKREIQPLQDMNNRFTGAFMCPGCTYSYNINVAQDPPTESDYDTPFS